jgi:hypothetical protein
MTEVRWRVGAAGKRKRSAGKVKINSMVSELKRGKRRRDNVVLVGELKAVTRCTNSATRARRMATHSGTRCGGVPGSGRGLGESWRKGMAATGLSGPANGLKGRAAWSA